VPCSIHNMCLPSLDIYLLLYIASVASSRCNPCLSPSGILRLSPSGSLLVSR
jgi:hypothetical protein